MGVSLGDWTEDDERRAIDMWPACGRPHVVDDRDARELARYREREHRIVALLALIEHHVRDRDERTFRMLEAAALSIPSV